MANIPLTKVNVIGLRAFHIFKDIDGVEEHVEVTLDEYNNLKIKGTPTWHDKTWVGSYTRAVYNTVSGEMEDYTYTDDVGSVTLKIPNLAPFTMSKADLNDANKQKIDERKLDIDDKNMFDTLDKWKHG